MLNKQTIDNLPIFLSSLADVGNLKSTFQTENSVTPSALVSSLRIVCSTETICFSAVCTTSALSSTI